MNEAWEKRDITLQTNNKSLTSEYKYSDFHIIFLDVANESITSYRDFKLLVNLHVILYMPACLRAVRKAK